jgi:hypothetical protein
MIASRISSIVLPKEKLATMEQVGNIEEGQYLYVSSSTEN